MPYLLLPGIFTHAHCWLLKPWLPKRHQELSNPSKAELAFERFEPDLFPARAIRSGGKNPWERSPIFKQRKLDPKSSRNGPEPWTGATNMKQSPKKTITKRTGPSWSSGLDQGLTIGSPLPSLGVRPTGPSRTYCWNLHVWSKNQNFQSHEFSESIHSQ